MKGSARSALVICTASALLCGCTPMQVAGVQPRALVSQPGPAAGKARAACLFNVEAIDDRRDVESLGQLGRTLVGGGGFVEWFTQGVASLPGHTDEAAPTVIKMTVLKAYVQGISTMKSVNLVVRVQFLKKGIVAASKVYRSVDNTMNWANSESEIQAAFDRALKDFAAQVDVDLQKHCQS